MTKTATMTLTVAFAALSVFGYDWPASGTATLTTADCDANGEVVVTDADYERANGLSGISVGAGVKLVFSTTAAPTVPLSGTGGTLVKRGDAEWTLTVAQPNFKGDWVLEGGVTIVDVNETCSFGAESAKYALYVRSGASFTVTAAALRNGGSTIVSFISPAPATRARAPTIRLVTPAAPLPGGISSWTMTRPSASTTATSS